MNRRALLQVRRHGRAWIRPRRLRAEDVSEAATRAAASAGAAAGGERVVGSRHSHHDRSAPASPVRASCCKADKLDGKTLIHNFGHGGSGMSLSWGTGVDGRPTWRCAHTERRAAVMGSGVVGLTSARELQRHGFDVTIYAATVPPDTTSNMSLAGFTPTSGLVDTAKRTPEWDAQFRAGGADRVSPAAAARRSEVRHQLDHELRADRQRSRPAAAASAATGTR